MAQELDSVEQDPLLLVLLDLQNAYKNVDWVRLLTTLEGYCADPHMFNILTVFWDLQEVVTRQN